MVKARLQIEGMHCDGCVTRVTNALKALPGVTVDTVTVGTAAVSYDEATATPASLLQTLQKMGFEAHVDPTASPSKGTCCGGSCHSK
jgi:copper chaperone CopZ